MIKCAGIVLLLLLHLQVYAQEGRYVKGKKVYRDLEEAIQNKDDVYNLELSGRNVIKEKLHHIGGMKNLQFLAIEVSSLDSLPDEVFRLPNLRTLNLCGSKYSDTKFTHIPDVVRRLKTLEYLVMYDNAITAIPDWIGELTRLHTLILPRNKIDTISPQIKHLQKLQYLSLGDNKLRHVPREIGQLSSLQELSLGENQLTGLPESLTHLKNLETLHLNHNKLVQLPAGIGNLRKLRSLQLGANGLSAVPASISQLTRLEELGLEDNPLGNFPAGFSFPRRLTWLSLSGEGLTELPPSLRHCRQLNRLDISRTSLTALPFWIGDLQQLEWLVLDENSLEAIPASLAALQRLEVLRFPGNKVDTIPGALFRLPRLRVLDAGKNPVRHIPLQVLQAPALKSFNVAGTRIAYEEYKAIRRRAARKLVIPHDKPVFYEDEEKPCYTEETNRTMPVVFTKLSFDPAFWGGPNAWQDFMAAHVEAQKLLAAFPDTAVYLDSVVLAFIVRKDGGISNITPVHYQNETARDEAVRLLRLSCAYWVPAMTGSRHVHSWTRQAFLFRRTSKGGKGEVSVSAHNPSPAPPRILILEED